MEQRIANPFALAAQTIDREEDKQRHRAKKLGFADFFDAVLLLQKAGFQLKLFPCELYFKMVICWGEYSLEGQQQPYDNSLRFISVPDGRFSFCLRSYDSVESQMTRLGDWLAEVAPEKKNIFRELAKVFEAQKSTNEQPLAPVG